MSPLLLVIPTLLAINSNSNNIIKERTETQIRNNPPQVEIQNRFEEMRQTRTEMQNQVMEGFVDRFTNNLSPLMDGTLIRFQNLLDRLSQLTDTSSLQSQLDELQAQAEKLQTYSDTIYLAEDPRTEFQQFQTEIQTWQNSLRQLRQDIQSLIQTLLSQND